MSDLLAELPKQTRIVIIQEANRLLAALPDCKAKARAEKVKALYLPELGKASSSRLKLGAYPLGAMLHQRPAMSFSRLPERDWLRGWALVATLRFCSDFGSDDHHSRLTAGLRVVRRMTAGGYRQDLMMELPSFDGTLEGSLSALRTLGRLLSKRGEDWQAQLDQLDLLLRGGETPIVPRFVEGSIRRSFPDDEQLPERIIRQAGLAILQSGNVPMARDIPPEEISEELRDRYYDFGATYRALQPVAAQHEAQLMLLEREAECIGLLSGFASLTPQEMRQIFTAALSDTRIGKPGAHWVLASMVSGRSIAELSAMSSKPMAGSTWRINDGGIAYAPDVRFMAHPDKGGFALYHPADLSNWINTSGSSHRAQEDAERWLKELSQQRHPRLSRIERALSDALRLQGVDQALSGLLTGCSTKSVIQLYYARFSVRNLRDLWLKALQDCYGASEGFRLEALDPKRREIGSLVVPMEKQVSKWFTGLIDAVHQARARRGDGVYHLVDRVAAEANLAASILCFQTARRPHREAFESLSQFTGRMRPRVRLGGKGGRAVDDGRWVPLATASQKAIRLWLNCLEELEASGLTRAHYGLRQRITDVRQGQAPLFFEWAHFQAQPESLNARDLFLRTGAPKLSADRARSTQAAPVENWARHFMRSALHEAEVPGKLIDSYMGHGGATSDPLASASGFAIADQDMLREAIDRIWQRLEVVLPAENGI